MVITSTRPGGFVVMWFFCSVSTLLQSSGFVAHNFYEKDGNNAFLHGVEWDRLIVHQNHVARSSEKSK